MTASSLELVGCLKLMGDDVFVVPSSPQVVGAAFFRKRVLCVETMSAKNHHRITPYRHINKPSFEQDHRNGVGEGPEATALGHKLKYFVFPRP